MSAVSEKSIAIGSDHGGFRLKEILKVHLRDQGYEVNDCGTFGEKSVDYPDIARDVAQQVAIKQSSFGVIVDGAGIGSAMVANKISGVRAALCYDLSSAKNSREHNDANVLTLGAGLIGINLAKQIVDTFLSHSCTVDRHLKRVQKIDEIETGRPIQPPIQSENSSPANNSTPEISKNELTEIAQRVSQLLNQNEIKPAESSGSQCDTSMICRCGICVDRTPETIRQFIDYGVERIGYNDATGCDCVPEDIAHCIDHTILKPDASEEDIKKLCAEAREFQFASVCVSPSYVPLVAKELAGCPVKVCTVVGFPSGAHMPEIKALETRRAIRDGAEEIDMVINVGALKSGNHELVYHDILRVSEACEDGGAISKVIIEAALLTDAEKIRACELAKKARANYVKTSTGFGPHGATAEDVGLMSNVVASSGIGVKAAGGIRTYEDVQKMILAGATRIGASAGIKILQQAKEVTLTN
jgi:deoxyribose-phosphate aldolase